MIDLEKIVGELDALLPGISGRLEEAERLPGAGPEFLEALAQIREMLSVAAAGVAEARAGLPTWQGPEGLQQARVMLATARQLGPALDALLARARAAHGVLRGPPGRRWRN